MRLLSWIAFRDGFSKETVCGTNIGKLPEITEQGWEVPSPPSPWLAGGPLLGPALPPSVAFISSLSPPPHPTPSGIYHYNPPSSSSCFDLLLPSFLYID